MTGDVSRETAGAGAARGRGTPAIDPAWSTPRGPWGYPAVVFGRRERISQEEFEALPTANRPDCLPGPPREPFKVLVGGRWHVCSRQIHFGQVVHHACPAVVVARQG